MDIENNPEEHSSDETCGITEKLKSVQIEGEKKEGEDVAVETNSKSGEGDEVKASVVVTTPVGAETETVKSSGSSASIQSSTSDKEKINIRLHAVGDAPILKQKLWTVPLDREVSQVIIFIKKYLKLEKDQNLFVFVNQSFAPSPDQTLRELYECFGSDGKIVLHYSTTYAWG